MNLPSGEMYFESSEFSMISHRLPQCCDCGRGELSCDSRAGASISFEIRGMIARIDCHSLTFLWLCLPCYFKMYKV